MITREEWDNLKVGDSIHTCLYSIYELSTTKIVKFRCNRTIGAIKEYLLDDGAWVNYKSFENSMNYFINLEEAKAHLKIYINSAITAAKNKLEELKKCLTEVSK